MNLDFALRKPFVYALTLINILGIGYGFYYYQQDFSEFPPYLWIFIADSPVAVLLFTVFLALLLAGKRNGLIEALAFIGMIKVGFWTAFIILVYNWYFLQPSYLYWYGSLLVLHIGMCLEGFAMKKNLAITRMDVLAASSLYIVNDALDYVFHLVPRRDIILGSQEFQLVAAESIIMTLVLSRLLLKLAAKN